MALTAWLGRGLDRVLYRHPFEGRGAARYAAVERPAFGDLDDRLLDGLGPLLTAGRTLLDVGAGPGQFAARAAARHAHLTIVAVEPSRDFARRRPDTHVLRAEGEALPLAPSSVDVAICLSSIRHVRDRRATLQELRRVVRPAGSLVIVELDPDASRARIAAHADRLGAPMLRHAFGPLVCRTAPPARAIASLAIAAGWTLAAQRADPVQPVYILELS